MTEEELIDWARGRVTSAEEDWGRDLACAIVALKARADAPSTSPPQHDPPATSQTRTMPRATRERLPDERRSHTKVFRLPYRHKDGTDDVMHFYFTPGEYPDGRVGECFVKADKVGSLASGLMDTIGVMISLLLQYGIPLETITSKLRGTRFSPSGFTGDPALRSCTSPMDLLARWLELKYGQKEAQ